MKKVPKTISLDSDVHGAITDFARAEHRTMSNLVEIILRQFLDERARGDESNSKPDERGGDHGTN